MSHLKRPFPPPPNPTRTLYRAQLSLLQPRFFLAASPHLEVRQAWWPLVISFDEDVRRVVGRKVWVWHVAEVEALFPVPRLLGQLVVVPSSGVGRRSLSRGIRGEVEGVMSGVEASQCLQRFSFSYA